MDHSRKYFSRIFISRKLSAAKISRYTVFLITTQVVSGAWSEFEEVDSNSINKGVLIGLGTYGPVHSVSVTLGGTGKKGKECKDVAMVTSKCKYMR